MKKLLLASLCIALIAAISCRKKTTPVTTSTHITPTYPSYSSLDTIYKMLAVKPKLFTFDAGLGTSFFGTSGTRYIFPAGCFQDANGTTVTGDVLVTVTEYLKRSDMAFSQIMPFSTDQVLKTGGELHVMVTQNGEKIFLKPGFNLTVKVPQGKLRDTGLSIYTGHPVIDPQGTKVEWVKVPDSTNPVNIFYENDSIVINSTVLEYFGAFAPMLTLPTQYFDIELKSGDNLANFTELNLYVVYKDYNTVSYGCSNSTSSIGGCGLRETEVCIVAIGLIKDKFWGGVSEWFIPHNGWAHRIGINEPDAIKFKQHLDTL